MQVYSTRFLAVHDQAGGVPAVYSVPAGKLAVIRDMDVYFGASLAARQVYAEGSAGQVFWQDSVGSTLAGWRSWRGRQVLYPGENFIMFGTDTFDLTASGYLLNLP